jgi:hypothetical protein
MNSRSSSQRISLVSIPSVLPYVEFREFRDRRSDPPYLLLGVISSVRSRCGYGDSTEAEPAVEAIGRILRGAGVGSETGVGQCGRSDSEQPG